jgi:hypothetical protein
MMIVQFMAVAQPVYETHWIGRAAHPIAAVFLVALAALSIWDVDFGPVWARFRYWAASGMQLVCLIPVNVKGEAGNGVVIGRLAAFIAVVAALLRRKEA